MDTMSQSILRSQPRIERDTEASTLASVINVIFENRWLIARIALVTAILGVAYAYSLRPLYEASILIQVKDNNVPPKDVPGSLPAAFDIKTQTATEMEVIRSRAVLARAANLLNLGITVEPKYFPLLGAPIALSSKRISNPGLFGFGGYVWGAEQVAIPVFNVPDALLPRPFQFVVQENGKFLLSQEETHIEVTGKIGEVVKASTRYGEIEILVAGTTAKPGAEFEVRRKSNVQVVDDLQKGLVIAEKGKQSNVIAVTLKGSKPELISKTLNEIGKEYVRLNAAQKAEEATKALTFFNQQLPELKQKLEQSESRFTDLRSKHGTLNVNEEATRLAQQSVTLQERLAETAVRREALLSRFTAEHPSVMLVAKQMQDLNRDLAAIKEKIQRMPAVEQEILRTSRDRQANLDMYSSLTTMGRQLSMVEAGRIDNVRLLDNAEAPVQPVTLSRSVMTALACIAGVFLGIATAFLKNALLGRVHGPRHIEEALGLTVSAIIPHSDSQELKYKAIRKKKRKILLLSHEAPSDSAIESLRIFRSTLDFVMRGSERNIIMMTGPTPEVGKSFVCANFAAVLASVGKKILLIDGDMRTGYLHRYFGMEPSSGLADVLAGRANVESVLHKDVVTNVDFLSNGNSPTTPVELLAHGNFGRMLRTLAGRYDYVLIDSAPVLDFADALIIGVHAGAIFSVVRDGFSSMHEAEEGVKRLNRAGLSVTGILLNDVRPNLMHYDSRKRYGAGALQPRFEALPHTYKLSGPGAKPASR